MVWWDSTGRGSGCQAGPVCTCLAGKPQSYHGSPLPTDPVDPFCGRGGEVGLVWPHPVRGPLSDKENSYMQGLYSLRARERKPPSCCLC